MDILSQDDIDALLSTLVDNDAGEPTQSEITRKTKKLFKKTIKIVGKNDLILMGYSLIFKGLNKSRY